MPAGLRAWYTPADFEVLAERRSALSGEFQAADMDRLVAHLGMAEGTCTARFAFSRREPGWIGLEVALHCQLTVTCQRCLGPLELEIAEQAELGYVADELSGESLPEGIDSVVMDGDRFSPLQLIEEEIIMAVPLVPRHPAEQCAVDAESLPEGVFADSGTTKRN